MSRPVFERYVKLKALEDDPMLFTEEGKRVDALMELASELYKKPAKSITFEQRNEVIKLVKLGQFQGSSYTRADATDFFNQQYQQKPAEQPDGWKSAAAQVDDEIARRQYDAYNAWVNKR